MVDEESSPSVSKVRGTGLETTIAEHSRARTDQSFLVPKADIVAQDYDLSINRYKEVVHDDVEHRDPLTILSDIEALENEIRRGHDELKAMLS